MRGPYGRSIDRGCWDKAGAIEWAIAALGSAQLDEPLRIEARQAAHMLSGDSTFWFTAPLAQIIERSANDG